MNTISQILPPFLQDANPIITTTNRYVNIDGESMPVVKRIVNGSPKDLWFSKDNRFLTIMALNIIRIIRWMK